jgi:hypothetical protein
MDNAKLDSEYKIDGTFTCGFPELPGMEGPFTGGYLVTGDILVGWLDFEGASAYKFKVADNDTIDVTEIVKVNEDGSFEFGNTTPFIRIAGSTVSKENRPLKLINALIGGKWTYNQTEYQFKSDGTATMKINNQSSEIFYFALHAEMLQTDVLVTFIPVKNIITAYAFTVPSENTATVKEISEITMTEQGLSATYGTSVTFTRSN